MELLIPFGVFFAVLFVFLAIVRTMRRAQQVRFFELTLAFLFAMLPLSALIMTGADGSPDSNVSNAVLVMALVLAVFGIFIIILELFRPQRLNGSRGILTLGIGILLALASFGVPIISVLVALPDPEPTPVAVAGTNADATQDSRTQEERDRDEFFAVFQQIFQIVADETGLSIDTVLTALDEGQSIAQIVRANGGSVDSVINQVTAIMTELVQSLIADGRIPRGQGALVIAQMGNFVRFAVDNNIDTLLSFGGGDEAEVEGTPGETPESIFTFLTVTPTAAMTDAPPTAEPTITLTSTRTAFPTATASLTRTPRPTATATPTRLRFQSPTPTLTATLPSPCLATMRFNVNLRAEPTLDAELLGTIPFETVVNVFGQNDTGTWWFVQYDGEAGWVSGEFIGLTPSCDLLPVRPAR